MKIVTKIRLVVVTLLAVAGSLCANAQSKTVTGVVKDVNNEPIIGASVFAETQGGEIRSVSLRISTVVMQSACPPM